MANEFIIKNGYFSQGNSTITGSLTISSSGTDTLRILKGASDVVQQGSSVYLVGDSGSSYTQLQQGVGRFTIWGYDGASWGEKLTINNTTGNVGIGMAPSHKFEVYNGSRSNTPSYSNATAWFAGLDVGLAIGNYDNVSYGTWLSSIRNNNTEYALTLQPLGGTVGIGKAAPNATLDVNGNTIISGSLNNGFKNITSGLYSHAEGYYTTASGQYAHSEGAGYVLSGEGTFYYPVIASGYGSHAEGYGTKARATGSHSEGDGTTADGVASHAEGGGTWASGSYSHAEGQDTYAFGPYSHTEGYNTSTNGYYSHAEGQGTIASASAAHAEGYYTYAYGNYSHTAGNQTVAIGTYQSVIGMMNISSSAEGAFIIGNGNSSIGTRSNLVFASGSTFQVTGSIIATAGITGSFSGDGSALTGITSAANIANTNLTFTANTTRVLSHSGTSRFIISGSSLSELPILDLNSPLTSPGRLLRMQQQLNNEPNRTIIRSMTAGGTNKDDGSMNGWASDYIAEYVSGSVVAPNQIKGYQWSCYSGASYTKLLTISSSGNIGIGTTTPSNKLHVVGGSALPATSGTVQTAGFRIGSSVGTTTVLDMGIYNSTGVSWIQSTDSSNLATNYLLLLNPNGGNVGIGQTTTQAYKLFVNGQPGANGYTAFSNYSDARLKENITDFMLTGSLDKIKQLRPVSFNYNSITGYDSASLARTNVGFIAQELQDVCPDMVGTIQINNIDYLDTNTSNLNLYLVRAMQEQQQIIEDLKNRIILLESK